MAEQKHNFVTNYIKALIILVKLRELNLIFLNRAFYQFNFKIYGK